MVSIAKRQRIPRKKMLPLFLALSLLVCSFIEFDPLIGGALVRDFNYFIYDTILKKSQTGVVADEIVIVDIDERSLSSIGQWPWPRYRLGLLIEKIRKMKPASIAVDVLMPEPDRTSLSSIQNNFKLDFDLDVKVEGVPTSLIDSDQFLGSIIDRTPTVSSIYFLFDHTSNTSCGIADIHAGGSLNTMNIYDAPGVLCNEKRLQTTRNLSGFINILDDEDGVLRRLPILIRHRGQVYPNLALAAVMQANQIREVHVERDRYGSMLKVGKYSLPLDKNGALLLNYPGPAGMYPYFSAVDLLGSKIDVEKLEGKIVFIGSSAAGLYDFHNTMYDPHYPGVETLAVTAGSIIHDINIREPVWKEELSLILSLVTASAVILLFMLVAKPLQAVAGTAILLALLIIGATVAFSSGRMSIPIGAPLLIAGTLFPLFSLIRYSAERRLNFLWLKKMARSQQVTLETMAMVVETRDYETGGHIKRTQHFVRVIAEELARRGKYTHILTPDYIEMLFLSAPLHDIGKVGVPDNILLKPGPLDFDEFELMKKHTDYGKHILVNSGQRLDDDNFLELACQIAESHHEKWDGTGYPLGLKNENIPLSGRIMMVADVYDALTSKRCYKPAYPHKTALTILEEGRNIFFDPSVLDAFFVREEDVLVIGERIRDE